MKDYQIELNAKLEVLLELQQFINRQVENVNKQLKVLEKK